MKHFLECVPNFSEGKDPFIIEEIAKAITSVEGVSLLHVDSGIDAHRTVYTFCGEANAVGEAAYRAVIRASELIDMRVHKGEHPRMGACDVCPFIPIGETPMSIAKEIALQTAEKIGAAGIPVYLYEESAQKPERKKLEFIRKGEYEALNEKLKLPEWQPDFGPVSGNDKFGAMVLGARPFLVAYNVNLDSKDVQIAKEIAAKIRESGKTLKDGTHIPGLLKGVKAIGWWMEAFDCVQVSTNITDINVCDAPTVFRTIKQLAAEKGISTKGSELIGLIPEKALLSSTGQSTEMEAIVQELGLDSLAPFDPKERILEYRMAEQ